MNRPQLTEQAEADLDEVWAVIAAENLTAANRMINAILSASRVHSSYPGLGQARDDLHPGIRCFAVSPYVVYYQPVESSIEILRILHGARDVESIFADET